MPSRFSQGLLRRLRKMFPFPGRKVFKFDRQSLCTNRLSVKRVFCRFCRNPAFVKKTLDKCLRALYHRHVVSCD